MSLVQAQSRREAFAARQATIATALLLLLSSFGFVVIEGALHGDIHGMYVAQGLLASGVALLLWRHRLASTRWSLLGFIVLLLPVFPILWSIESRAIAHGGFWQPFTGQKLVLLGIAALTPSALLALALLALFMAEWALLMNRFDLLTHPVLGASGEPWVTLLYFAAALLLVGLRWRNLRLERQLTAAELEAQMLREVTQIAAAIRDQLSTPLQNLELSIATLRERHPEEEVTLERMRRSLQRLIDLRPLGEDVAEVARLRALRQDGERLEQLLEAPP